MDNIEKINQLAERIRVPDFDTFPDIELYMDQVLDFITRSRTSLRRDDKLSSAMVNNYIKAELLPRARGKKYSREHLAHLAVIMRLKHVLSVKDTGTLIALNKDDKSDRQFYEDFQKMVANGAKEIADKILSSDSSYQDLAMQLAVSSYLNKIACEHIIDTLTGEAEDY